MGGYHRVKLEQAERSAKKKDLARQWPIFVLVASFSNLQFTRFAHALFLSSRLGGGPLSPSSVAERGRRVLLMGTTGRLHYSVRIEVCLRGPAEVVWTGVFLPRRTLEARS